MITPTEARALSRPRVDQGRAANLLVKLLRVRPTSTLLAIAALLGLAVGCRSADSRDPGRWPPDADELAVARREIRFESVSSPSLEGFSEHDRKGSRSASFDAAEGEVLVVDSESLAAILVRGFPTRYGGIVSCGWEAGGSFYVHLTRASDCGTMLYLDPDGGRVERIEHWTAW